MENFHYAQSLAKTLFDIEMQSDDFEEIALVAWNKIGNKWSKLYRYIDHIDCSDNSITLPCNCDPDYIESVNYMFEDWNYETNHTSIAGDFDSLVAEAFAELGIPEKDPLYVSGKLAKYEQVGRKLYFDKNYGCVQVLYHGVILDEEGLPELTEKEAFAIACYVAYTMKYKEAIRTNNGNIMNLALQLKRDWLVACDQASTPTHLSQNDMDKILDAKHSWNRKVYRKSYKPTR